MRTPTKILFSVLSANLLLIGCHAQPRATIAPMPHPPVAATQPINRPGLHNLVSYSDTIICGAVPEGLEGFESIRAMGIKTVISVDGAKPDVELAHEAGLKYIHLPIGYNGLSEKRTLEIAEAIKSANGPVYIHCHHGKHRSAGAAAAAAVTLGLLTNEQAIEKMKISGTAPAYKGLYHSAEVARPNLAILDTINNNFPEVCTTNDLVDAMVGIDETMDLLKAIEKSGWKTPADHPDLVPAAEAGKLADQLRIAHGIPSQNDYPKSFFASLDSASKQATTLEEGLVAGDLASSEHSARFKLIGQSCKDCHTQYRDPVVPQ